jgi:glutathione S-transferase
MQVNPKGYVPALQFDDGQVLTENVAILDWIAHRCPRLAVPGEMGHTRLLEMLAFISTEVHKQFGRLFFSTSDAEKEAATEKIGTRLQYLAGRWKGDYLFGSDATVADAYLYVMLRWATKKKMAVPEPLPAFMARMEARPAVQTALEHEALTT